MKMRLFIADHLGREWVNNDLFQTVHTGHALASNKISKAVDVDDGYPESISHKEVFADLRCLHHVWKRHAQDLDYIGILQYRRMFYFDSKVSEDEPLDQYLSSLIRSNYRYEYEVNHKIFERYLKRLKSLSSDDIVGKFKNHSILVNKSCFQDVETIETQYIRTIAETYPNDMRYVDAWWKIEEALCRRFSSHQVRNVLDGGKAYYNNILIARRDVYLDYCRFLFDLLSELSEYDNVYRLYGYLAERIFTVYLLCIADRDKDFSIGELPVLFNGESSEVSIPRKEIVTHNYRAHDVEGGTVAFEFIKRELVWDVILNTSLIAFKTSISDTTENLININLKTKIERQIKFRVWVLQNPVTLIITDLTSNYCTKFKLGINSPMDISLNLSPATDYAISIEKCEVKKGLETYVCIDKINVRSPFEIKEGFQIATPETLNETGYADANSDLAALSQSGGDLKQHLLKHGIFEGRLQRVSS